MPGRGLRIALVEMGEEGSVREVLQARGIIRHDVEVSWEVVGEVTVAVLALVAAGEVAEEGGCAVAGDRALVDTGDGRGVVRQVDERGVPGVMGGTHEVDLGQETGLFEVAVGDGAARVVEGNKAALHVGGEWGPPDVGVAVGVEVDAAHAWLGGVRGPEQARVLRDDLGQVGGS